MNFVENFLSGLIGCITELLLSVAVSVCVKFMRRHHLGCCIVLLKLKVQIHE